MRLVLVRHGATDWSVAARHTGITDLPLTELGREQATATAKGIRRLLGENYEPSNVYSSPLVRSLETASIVCGQSGPIIEDPRLLEFNYGDYEGLTPAAIRELRPEWDIWRDGCPNGETAETVGHRVDAFITSLPGSDETNIVFSHGHLIRILAARSIGLNAEQGRIFTLDTATISVVEDVRGKRVIKLWNLDASLLSSSK
jgi:probable phosphoglycerate mutase